jgi:hypothetical protein
MREISSDVKCRATFVLRKLRILAAILLSLGVGAVIVGVILPAYKTPQTFTGSGPKVPFTKDRNYWIDYYLIPPIDESGPIVLTLVASRPGATLVYLGPFDIQTSSLTGPAVVNEMLGQNETGLVIFTRAPKSSMYSLRITSWNSTYLVRLQSVWSAYFEFRYGIVVGAALIPASLLLIYYDGIVEKRERMFQEALDKATGKSH